MISTCRGARLRGGSINKTHAGLRNIYRMSIVIRVGMSESKNMNNADAVFPSAASRRGNSWEKGMRQSIGSLLSERDVLQEEIRQLRAAVHIYTEIVRRLQAGRAQQAMEDGASRLTKVSIPC